MSIRINTNVTAMNVAGQLGQTQELLGRSYGRLASGNRIATAADDAAGLAIGNKMKAEIRSLRVAQRNIQDGVSLVQVAEGALAEFSDLLVRSRELAMQAANGALSPEDRSVIDTERAELADETARLLRSVQFNGVTLFERGSPLVAEGVEIFAGSQPDETLSLQVTDVQRVAEVLEVLTFQNAISAHINLRVLDIGIDIIAGARGELGAFQNRLESAGRTVANRAENLAAARSQITDLDYASEMAEVTRLEILQQSAALVLGQANVMPEIALELMAGAAEPEAA